MLKSIDKNIDIKNKAEITFLFFIYSSCKVYAERFYNSHNDTTKNNNTIQIMAVIIIVSQKRNAFALGTNYAISIQMNKAIVNIKLYLAYNDLSLRNMKIMA